MNTQMSAALVAQIERLAVPEGQLALWSLGQAGFVIKGGATIAYIDPYLSNTIGDELGGPPRRIPIVLDPAAATPAQVVFATHEHGDHLDPPTLLSLLHAAPAALLVTSPQSAAIMVAAGLSAERIVTPKIGERVALAGLHYTALPAAHYDYVVDEQGRARWMGFYIECNGVRLYHAGDTIIFPELLAALKDRPVDIALLPINGRDFIREEQDLTGNMWPGEAVELAQRIAARVLIGVHNDLFASNRVSSGLLFDELDRRAPSLRCHTLQAGELYLYAG